MLERLERPSRSIRLLFMVIGFYQLLAPFLSWLVAHPSKSTMRVVWSAREVWTVCSFESRELNLEVWELGVSSVLVSQDISARLLALLSLTLSAVKVALPHFAHFSDIRVAGAIQLVVLDNNATIGAWLKYILKDMNLNGLAFNSMPSIHSLRLGALYVDWQCNSGDGNWHQPPAKFWFNMKVTGRIQTQSNGLLLSGYILTLICQWLTILVVVYSTVTCFCL